MERKRSICKLVRQTHLCCSVFFLMLSICTMVVTTTTTASSSTIICLDTRCHMFFKSEMDFQEVNEEYGQGIMSLGITTDMYWGGSRKLLSGPGSFPPRCNAKCGRCTPCRPVHVTVPPGTPVTAEYYPEAWRCKCGNKLYMP